ncbi:MAG TPA: phosphotransferase [bacterium]|nr:MAG: Phosphotransferase enzyme family protein [Parcubacteria group bacterium ADurb.Bin192]HPN15013.1 phosphotransferase [bacterium]
MSLKKYRTIKVIQDYPLSRVEIVEWRGKKYILKSVPKIWDAQIKRQDYLAKHCQEPFIPRIHRIQTIKGRKFFLMDFIQSDNQRISDETYIKTLGAFHAQTTKVKSKLFPVYDFSALKHEFSKINTLLPTKLRKLLKTEVKGLEDVFRLQTSVVHGDWVRAQLMGNKGKYWIIDFEMAFYGPSILDHAHFFLGQKTISRSILSLLGVDKQTFHKARIVEALRKIGWFVWFMENKFTTYKFGPEIKEYVATLERLMGGSSSKDSPSPD